MKIMPHETPAAMRASAPKAKPKRRAKPVNLPFAPRHPWAHDEEIRRLTTERSWTPAMIARYHGMSRNAVALWVWRRGYKRAISNKSVKRRDIDWLSVWSMHEQGETLRPIAREVGANHATVRDIINTLQDMTPEDRERVFQFREDWLAVMGS